MDFFEHQARARKSSARLVWLYAAAVACIVAMIYAATKALLVVGKVNEPGWLDVPLLSVVTACVAGLVFGAMLFKSAQLRGGGAAVARMMGGKKVLPHTKDPQERVLMNVVEEMSIASGVPVPDVFILHEEASINAFAAGWSTEDAAVAVTRGSLEKFNRAELQGVIAHEFSHIFHGDMRLNIRLMGTLFGIICLTVIGRVLMHTGRHGKRDGQQVALFGLVLVAIGYVGVLFARMIQAAVSRQREYLADAAAVQYTRHPKGIGMALAKIGGVHVGLKTPHAEEASHMLFADGIKRMGGSLATHPPIKERVERVLPGFLKNLSASKSLEAAVEATAAPAAPAGAAGFAGPTPQRVLESVGDPQPQHVAAARQLLDVLPQSLIDAARETGPAVHLAYALLLDEEDHQRHAQLALLESEDAQLPRDAAARHSEMAALSRTMRLPLLELAMPALRELSAAERRIVLRRARALALADGHISPFEFALLKTLERHLPLDNRPARRAGRIQSLHACVNDAGVVLSVIAHAGAPDDPAGARAAFERGRSALQLPRAQLVDADSATPQHLDQAIPRLGRISPAAKRKLIHACAEVAAHDGHLAPDEVDLIRVLAELWACPVPLTIPA